MGTHSNTIPYSNTYAHCYTYTDFYAYTHSVNHSHTQSDSQASRHATSSPDTAAVNKGRRTLLLLSTEQAQNDKAQMKRRLFVAWRLFSNQNDSSAVLYAGPYLEG
jgi:hypothetical protein